MLLFCSFCHTVLYIIATHCFIIILQHCMCAFVTLNKNSTYLLTLYSGRIAKGQRLTSVWPSAAVRAGRTSRWRSPAASCAAPRSATRCGSELPPGHGAASAAPPRASCWAQSTAHYHHHHHRHLAACRWMDVAVSTSDLHAEGLLMAENTSAEMSPSGSSAGKRGHVGWPKKKLEE